MCADGPTSNGGRGTHAFACPDGRADPGPGGHRAILPFPSHNRSHRGRPRTLASRVATRAAAFAQSAPGHGSVCRGPALIHAWSGNFSAPRSIEPGQDIAPYRSRGTAHRCRLTREDPADETGELRSRRLRCRGWRVQPIRLPSSSATTSMRRRRPPPAAGPGEVDPT
jgi:hypothetical protein